MLKGYTRSSSVRPVKCQRNCLLPHVRDTGLILVTAREKAVLTKQPKKQGKERMHVCADGKDDDVGNDWDRERV